MQTTTKHELTMQETANFLNVSRPFVIEEVEAKRIKFRKVNGQRRIEFEELRRYQAGQQQKFEQALQDLINCRKKRGWTFNWNPTQYLLGYGVDKR